MNAWHVMNIWYVPFVNNELTLMVGYQRLLFILNKLMYKYLKELKAQFCDLYWYLDELLRMSHIVLYVNFP